MSEEWGRWLYSPDNHSSDDSGKPPLKKWNSPTEDKIVLRKTIHLHGVSRVDELIVNECECRSAKSDSEMIYGGLVVTGDLSRKKATGVLPMKTQVRQIYQKGEGEWLGDDQQLWRYIPYKTLFLYLKGKAYIPTIEKLRERDPFEGDFPFGVAALNQALRDRCGSQHESVIKWIHGQLCTDTERKMIKLNRKHGDYVFKIYQRRYLAFLRRTRYAWCWFASGIESALMWNSYGRERLSSLRKPLKPRFAQRRRVETQRPSSPC